MSGSSYRHSAFGRFPFVTVNSRSSWKAMAGSVVSTMPPANRTLACLVATPTGEVPSGCRSTTSLSRRCVNITTSTATVSRFPAQGRPVQSAPWMRSPTKSHVAVLGCSCPTSLAFGPAISHWAIWQHTPTGAMRFVSTSTFMPTRERGWVQAIKRGGPRWSHRYRLNCTGVKHPDPGVRCKDSPVRSDPPMRPRWRVTT